MAGDWIKMRADLLTHPKVIRISSALKADVLRTVGGLMSVWCLFDAHSVDGHLSGYTTEVLDHHLRWEGFSRAMIEVEWLGIDDSGNLFLPQFDTHNGQSAKRRAQDADRKRESRKASAPEADKKRTREEKRREDISTPNGVDVGPPSKRALKKCPSSFEITDDLRAWASESTPSVNLETATAMFRDHTFKNAITDWAGAWRNWMRKDQQSIESRRPKPRLQPVPAENFANRTYGSGGAL